jgi:hypothetical protein
VRFARAIRIVNRFLARSPLVGSWPEPNGHGS